MTGRRLVVLTVLMGALSATATTASAAHPDEQIVLPGATSAEGIAKGVGSTFYAGDLFTGDIYRGDLQRGTAELFVDAPPGRMAVGMAVDVRHGLLFVAGGFDGTAHIYDTRTGATVAAYQLADPASVINDVAVSKKGAWFTDSVSSQLYFIPDQPDRSARRAPHAAAQRTGGGHQRGVQQQRDPGHGRRQDADRRAQRAGRAEHRRPDDRRQSDDRGCQCPVRRRHPAQGRPVVRGAELPQPDRRGPGQPGPGVRNRGEGRAQRAVPSPDHGRPLRRPAGHGQRQVRHPASRRRPTSTR